MSKEIPVVADIEFSVRFPSVSENVKNAVKKVVPNFHKYEGYSEKYILLCQTYKDDIVIVYYSCNDDSYTILGTIKNRLRKMLPHICKDAFTIDNCIDYARIESIFGFNDDVIKYRASVIQRLMDK